jgi:hypothetical protein
VFKKIRTLSPILITAGLILAGCNFPSTKITPTPTPKLPPELSQLVETPLPSGDPAACVAGSWQVQDVTPILTAILPADILEANNLTLTGSEGIFRYDFSPTGSLTGTAENFKILGKTKRGPFNVDVAAVLNGQGTGNYTVDPQAQEIVLTNLVDKGFTLDVTVGGVSVYKQDSSQMDLWFGGASDARVHYECSGSTLVLTLNLNGQSVPVTLTRINP